MIKELEDKLRLFKPEEVQDIAVPAKFTFPFFYEPHPLTQLAAQELQHYLETQFTHQHNFGLDASQSGQAIGKMFGVLVVQTPEGKLGYLSAFSGKLAGTNTHSRFVPPVFDMLTENSFFLQEEQVLNSINREIAALEANPDLAEWQQAVAQYRQEADEEIAAFKLWVKERKAQRKQQREAEGSAVNEAELIRESNLDQFKLRMLKDSWATLLAYYEEQIANLSAQIEALKQLRKEKSAALQNQLFQQYSFINKAGEWKNLGAIFAETVFEKPPAGAGECATPKLLQYAFLNKLRPIAFGEFWWGASPKSEVRKHQQFYAACSGKCKPILKHMLAGVPLEDNPLLENLAEHKQLKIVYEDDHLIVVNKPAELLSVPGIAIQDSVYTRLQKIMGGVEPLIIHRLDMSTSGLLVVAKTKQAHKHIQNQFIKRTVKKRYTALLSGRVAGTNGEINLPLYGDVVDRPRQQVCFEKGKRAVTQWQVVDQQPHTTKIHFWPVTGRTHQLRVHAAHQLGLNAPIVGDDLYGTPADRLHLHAAWIQFQHPISKETLVFEEGEEF